MLSFSGFLAAYTFNDMRQEFKEMKAFIQTYPAEMNPRIKGIEKDVERLRIDVDGLSAEQRALFYEFKSQQQ